MSGPVRCLGDFPAALKMNSARHAKQDYPIDRKIRRSLGKLLDALDQAAESFVHVVEHLGFCSLRT